VQIRLRTKRRKNSVLAGTDIRLFLKLVLATFTRVRLVVRTDRSVVGFSPLGILTFISVANRVSRTLAPTRKTEIMRKQTMPKVRVHRITARNVHQQVREYIVPAPSSSAALQCFNDPNLHYDCEFIGYRDIEIHWGTSGMSFHLQGVVIEHEHPSYEYMYTYYARDIGAFVADLKRTGHLLPDDPA
jgi:hypothetical protein